MEVQIDFLPPLGTERTPFTVDSPKEDSSVTPSAVWERAQSPDGTSCPSDSLTSEEEEEEHASEDAEVYIKYTVNEF